MRFLLSITMVFSFSLVAEEDKPVYEANVAEYYVSSFKDGKDMDDMMKWAEKWKKWATNVSGYSLSCGHYLPEEAPKETLAALLSFL